MRWEQVNLGEGFLYLEPGTTKSGHGRMIPLVSELRDVLTRWKDHTLIRYPGCPWICHYRGSRLKSIPKRTWRTICDRVGIRGKLFHDLRRTAIRNWVRSGVSERVVMEISGHKTREVFDRYDIVNAQDLIRAQTRLETQCSTNTD